jgi:predicted GIY-YIG superfamily endonuclease
MPLELHSGLLDHCIPRKLVVYMAWMYILECADGSYYVGSTRNLDQRIMQHQSGKGSRYTSGRLPVKLVYGEEYDPLLMHINEKSRFKTGAERNEKH